MAPHPNSVFVVMAIITHVLVMGAMMGASGT
jgi:hypothetical protein